MFWNPNPVAFTIPYFNIPIYIYGLCFVIGFAFGYWLLMRMIQRDLKWPKSEVQSLVDQLTWFVVGGTIIGARLGHVLFYDWERYRANPLLILNTREGGLASHGGALGVLLALGIYYFFFFKRKTKKTFLVLLDWIVVPTAFVGFMIRVGNFFNQEILGTPTNLPWGVTFGSPADFSASVPRHPAQLYEGFAYLFIFFLLLGLWKWTTLYKRQGFLSGLFFVLVFGSRFLIEYVKEVQESVIDQHVLQAGQWLSLPFILGGVMLIFFALRRKLNAHSSNTHP